MKGFSYGNRLLSSQLQESWLCVGQLAEKLAKLGPDSVAELEDLDANCVVFAHSSNDRPDSEGEAFDFESQVKLVAGLQSEFSRGAEEAAIEAQIDDLALNLPVIDAELDGPVTAVARGPSGVGGFIHRSESAVARLWEKRGECSSAGLIDVPGGDFSARKRFLSQRAHRADEQKESPQDAGLLPLYEEQLVAIAGADGDLVAALGAAAAQNGGPGLGLHPAQEAVGL